MSKTIRITFTAGRISGFSLGFCVSKYFATFDFGFWYIGLEY